MSEVFALGELSEEGALSQQDLAGRLGLEKSTVSRLAAGMERGVGCRDNARPPTGASTNCTSPMKAGRSPSGSVRIYATTTPTCSTT